MENSQFYITLKSEIYFYFSLLEYKRNQVHVFICIVESSRLTPITR